MELNRRNLILHKYVENSNVSIRKISKNLNIPKSTVGDVIQRFKETLTTNRKNGSGGSHGQENRKDAQKVIQCFAKDPKISTRSIARKLKKSQSFVQRAKKKGGLKTFKAQKVPDRDAKQNRTMKSRCRKIYDQELTKCKCVVMDDETYTFKKF